MGNARRRNEDSEAPRVTRMLRIPIFKWPPKSKPAGNPTVFDVRWLLIVASEAWNKKVLFRHPTFFMREASDNNPFSLLHRSQIN